MAATAICRPFSFCKLNSIFRFHRLYSSVSSSPSLSSTSTTPSAPFYVMRKGLHFIVINHPPANLRRLFCSSSEPTSNTAKKINTKVNFSLSDSDSDSEEKDVVVAEKAKLPPPYDPFNKKAVIEEPDNPKDLQEIFHKMRTEGLLNNAVKMFDGLSKDGLTHEALELFSQIKDKGSLPDVVAHTAVIEVYANAGKSKEALKVYLRMLASGVLPNAYTYTVLIKGLAADGKLTDAKKYVLEMMEKGMQPNVGTYAAVFEAFARDNKVEEGKEFLEEMKGKGFVPNEKAVREVINNKRGQVFRTVINILFGK